MKDKKIIIIGMGPAATGAAAAIQHSKKKVNLTLVDRKNYEMYSPCAMPFAFEGKLNFQDLRHEFPVKGPRTTIKLNTEVKKIDTDNKELSTSKKGKKEVLKYDSLIIATGTKPFTPPIKNIKKFPNVYTVNSLENVGLLGCKTKDFLEEKGSCKVSVIGAGAIGIEFALAIKKRHLDVLVTEMMPQVFPNAIDQDMAGLVQEYLEQQGVEIITDSKVKSVKGKNKTIESLIIGKKEYETDFIVLACGTIPNIELVKGTNIIYNNNGIVTDNRMMTNVKDVYTAGDCVETFDAITKKKYRSGLTTQARKQGRIAGINITGGRTTYKGTLNTFISVLDEYAIGSTGLTSEQAKAEGYELVIQKIKGLNKPEYYPGKQDLVVKLIANKKGKILGGQVFGEKNAVKGRIDIIASYLSRKSNVKDMIDGELAYCPDVAPIPDPLTSATEFMLRRIKK